MLYLSSGKLIVDPDPDQSKNLTDCSLSEGLSLPEISRAFHPQFSKKCLKMPYLHVGKNAEIYPVSKHRSKSVSKSN